MIEVLVEDDHEGERVMTFLTNNPDWAASSIRELCKARWGIEAFFKQIKQQAYLPGFG